MVGGWLGVGELGLGSKLGVTGGGWGGGELGLGVGGWGVVQVSYRRK